MAGPDPYRASDHDPVIVGLSLGTRTALTKISRSAQTG
jgi:predicted extracellular nuclease